MPLRTPILDDRSYAQLREELIARIPVHTPEWTDHHESDPGIALLELLAFLGENLLFRFNQIPDATRLAFLDLLQIPLRPAQPATALVTLTTTAAGGVLVPAGAGLAAGELPFTALGEATAWPLGARAAIRARVSEDLDADTLEYLGRSGAAVGASIEQVLRYRTVFGALEPARPGGDLLDPATSVDGTLYLALTLPAPGAVPPDPAELAGRELAVGVIPALEVPAITDVERSPGRERLPPAPPMRWQICTTTPVPDPPIPDAADPVWLDLAVAGDTTAGLLTSGVVRLRLPEQADLARVGIYLPADPDATGAGDQPPLIEDEELGAVLLAWLRVFRPDGAAIGAVEWVGVNAAQVEQAEAARAEFLGTGTGEPGQELRLVHAQVLGAVDLDVEEAGRWVPWTQTDDVRAAGPDDRVFTLDRQAGVVRFGDGQRGRPPQIGERVRARGYRYGGGAPGNVGAGAITTVRTLARVSVTNPLPASGGADPQSLAEAVEQVPLELARRDRAVTASDFRELAQATPGAAIVRAETLPLFNPHRSAASSPGAVSVVVWPGADRQHPQAPRPDRVTLERVCEYLDERRLITTELYVIPPTYRPIAVSVGFAVKPGFGSEGVRRWVETVLRQYLSPVPPYGPAGRGWPLGRAVFGPELQAAALQVEGLEFLTGLRLSELVAGGWVERTAPARVDLAAWEVPELLAVTATPGEAAEPGGTDGPIAPPGGPAVPVRTPKEVC